MKFFKKATFKGISKPAGAQLAPSFNVAKLGISATEADLLFEVTIPNGQSSQLEVIKTGQAPYGTVQSQQAYLLLQADFDQVVSGVKKYQVIIDAPDGDTSISTSVAIKIGGQTFYTLTKEHSDPPGVV